MSIDVIHLINLASCLVIFRFRAELRDYRRCAHPDTVKKVLILVIINYGIILLATAVRAPWQWLGYPVWQALRPTERCCPTYILGVYQTSSTTTTVFT